MGYSLNPVAPIAQPDNPVYTPLRFALRAYLEPFVLNNPLEEKSEKSQSDLRLYKVARRQATTKTDSRYPQFPS